MVSIFGSPSGFLAAGSMALPSGLTPYVEFRELTQQWKWIGKTISLFFYFPFLMKTVPNI